MIGFEKKKAAALDIYKSILPQIIGGRVMGKGQLAVSNFSLDAMITDYHWMLNAVKDIRAELEIGAKTAQYGIEAITKGAR